MAHEEGDDYGHDESAQAKDCHENDSFSTLVNVARRVKWTVALLERLILELLYVFKQVPLEEVNEHQEAC